VPEVTQVEERLAALRDGINWPSTPQLAGRVRDRIAQPAPVVRPWFQSRWAVAAVLALLLLAALLAYTPSRDVIARWLNLHTTITHVEVLPTPSPQPSGPLFGIGYRTTLADAQSKVPWHIEVPASLGQPDEVYLLLPPTAPPQGEVTLVYKSRPGFKTAGQTGVAVLITEVNGKADAQFFGKVIGNGTTIEEVTVNGHQGYWISGQPHEFFFTDADGNVRSETLRLATNTLLIDYNGTIIRIEGDMTKSQALGIANSLT
jgi:hypothetical protein